MRLIVADDFIDMADNHGDAFGKRRAGRRFDTAGSNIMMFAAVDINNAEAGYATAGVDAENACRLELGHSACLK
ncbi:hypothetical protein NEISUBOT_05455 [Neisseria subflava NJ9703]|uniref:Uncharacterized protein n=1 Tax=Neisseria subflava NJ9703 TaxID=546268 RepID=A0A9W5IP65_NEISU|nr:hypothetical protein NEISUBOT_05455 [Neisseria subflava NJ9703]